jgi:cytidine deaminase
MKDKLNKLLNNAYAPYSNYKVAAIVVMNDLKEYSGVNVENASFGATICAERNAINSAIKDGYKYGDFKELYVMTDKEIAFPCFICRQTINEFFLESSKLVLLSNTSEETYLMKDILAHPFSKSDLK